MRVPAALAIVRGALCLPLPAIPTAGTMDTSPLKQPYQPAGPNETGGSGIGSSKPSKNANTPLQADGMYGLPYIEQPKPKAYANPLVANPAVVVYVGTTVYALPPVSVETTIAK
ncbi:hypothetical protein TWF481_005228 [Arthrobotrys musiformis]|uniref:Uncharacterized protein n=1 Tax=Arthrobotrys musiformis TaxID=47236 RepID=A0AAV9WD89_9PEZI